jgi:hypothetical protein
MSVSVDRIWRLTRQPFILPCTPRVLHRCKWEIFAAGRAGCTVCGAIHVCDQLTCQHQIMTEDSILCSITGCFLNKIYGSETWSDRSISMSVDKKHVNELTYDIETHLHDLLLSNNAKAYTQFEHNSVRLTYLSVYDRRDDASETTPSPSPPSSLTYVHRCIGSLETLPDRRYPTP